MKALVEPMVRFLMLPLLVTAGALWLKGGTQTGGGFSAGIVAALAFLLHHVAAGPDVSRQFWVVRHGHLLTVTGLAVVVALAIAPLLAGQPLLTQTPPVGAPTPHFGIVEIRTQSLFELGIFLVVFGFILGIGQAIGVIETGET